MRGGQLGAGFVLQGLEQAVELQGRLLLPVQLFQAAEQGGLLVVAEAAVGQVEVEGIAGVDLGAGQAEKQAELARQAGKEPAAADIGEQTDADFRHGQAAGRRDDADRCALHQAHAAAHDITVGPADQRFRVGVDAVVEAVFVGEEAPGQLGDLPRLFPAGLHQLQHIAAGAESLGAVAAQQHAGDARVVGPGRQFAGQGFDHWQGQGVQALLGVQGGDADAVTVLGVALFKVQVHGWFHRPGAGL